MVFFFFFFYDGYIYLAINSTSIMVLFFSLLILFYSFSIFIWRAFFRVVYRSLSGFLFAHRAKPGLERQTMVEFSYFHFGAKKKKNSLSSNYLCLFFFFFFHFP
jgi:hypothetical protein